MIDIPFRGCNYFFVILLKKGTLLKNNLHFSQNCNTQTGKDHTLDLKPSCSNLNERSLNVGPTENMKI